MTYLFLSPKKTINFFRYLKLIDIKSVRCISYDFFCLKEMVFDKQILTSNQITTIFIHPTIVYCLLSIVYCLLLCRSFLCVCGVFLVFLVEENSKLCMFFLLFVYYTCLTLEIQL